MRALDLIHRWTGGLLGLLLAVLGLTGAILIHKEEWIALPHASDPRVDDPAVLGATAARLLAGAKGGESLVFATDRFGLVQGRTLEGSGFYAAQTGEIVERWSSQWQRPELWLFDLHHHLFAGDTGKFVAGIAGLAVVLFCITGTILWWRTRRTFGLRVWPRRMSGTAIRMHHRDLGIVAAPILMLVALTGSALVFRPVADWLLVPLSAPGTVGRDLAPPPLKGGALGQPDWSRVVVSAHAAFPDAELRILALPRKPGDPITVRMRRAAEWLPNGRTMLWFDAASGRLLGQRDALAMQPATQAFNAFYPLHAGKVGGIGYRALLTVAGLALAILGSLSLWSFWFKPSSGSRRGMGTRRRSLSASRDRDLAASARAAAIDLARKTQQ